MRIVLSICLFAKACESSYTNAYIAVNQLKTWSDAEAYCQSQYGTHLATIFDDDSHREFLSVRDATLWGQYTWTGLNDQANEGVYEWADGTEYYPTIAPYWRTGWCCFEDQDCVLSLYQQHTITQSLGEAPCDGERVFICNAPAYIAVNQAKTWSDADAYCQSQYGTHLATIFDDDSHREFLFVRDATLPNQYTWIGLNDQANEGEYVWADGTEYGPTIAPYWRTGWCCFEDQDCVLSLYQQHTITQSLGEAPCDGERVFICNARPFTPSPTQSPTKSPTKAPTKAPTKYPTVHTSQPSQTPTRTPTQNPSQSPSKYPTSRTNDPSETPTDEPTVEPTVDPTADPTTEPTVEPTTEPTVEPTYDPTVDPTIDPTVDPTKDPTRDPTRDPTVNPTVDPTDDPTTDPTDDPTTDPTYDPTDDPTADPTDDPTDDPTTDPTDDPTIDPTIDPTVDPTTGPTMDPTNDPTNDPTTDPTVNPSLNPSTAPTASPSTAPHSLERAIEMSISEDGSSVNQTYIYVILFGIPALIICFVFVMKSTVLKDKLLSIDRVEYISVGLYFLQVFDLYSDAMFTLQLHAYYSWAKHT
eukprot:1007488_1